MPPPLTEILALEPSPLGPLCLRRRRLLGEPRTEVTEVILNGEFLMSSLITVSERALAEKALEMHPGRNLDVWVGGLGLGFTAREILRSERVARVEVVELLPQVLGWLERGLLPCSAYIKSDPRCRVSEGDIFARILESPERKYDLILIDVDHSPEEVLGGSSRSFYLEDGLRKAKEHLAPAGVLGVWSYAGNASFEEALRKIFPEVRIEPITYLNDVLYEYATDWLFLARSK